MEDPFNPTSKLALELWIEYCKDNQKSTDGIINVVKRFEKCKILALKKHSNPYSVLPLDLSLSGDSYVLIGRSESKKNIKYISFKGCKNINVQDILEIRLYFCQQIYRDHFDYFRQNSLLADYDEQMGVMIIKMEIADPNVLLGFKTYHQEGFGEFLKDNAEKVLQARMKPLERSSQKFVCSYVQKAEKMGFSKKQCLIVLNAFLQDLINAANPNPLSSYNEECINNWLKGHETYFNSFEPNYLLDNYNATKIEYLRCSQSKNVGVYLPVIIKVANWDFVITEELGRGGYGVTYDGYVKGIPHDKLVLKLLFTSDQNVQNSFYNEITALNVLKRLMVYDASLLVICYRKVIGMPLDLLLEEHGLGSQMERLIYSKYAKLSDDFYQNTRLVHGDIRPQNIIMDPNQNLQLIDFGMTKSGSRHGSSLQLHLEADYSKSMNEYKHFFAKIEAQNAKKNPSNPNSAGKILQLLASLRATKRFNELKQWSDYFTSTYCCDL